MTFEEAVSFEIYINSDDGHFMYINGFPIAETLEEWQGCGNCRSGHDSNGDHEGGDARIIYDFSAGTHLIELFHYESAGGAKLTLEMTPVTAGSLQTTDPLGGQAWNVNYYEYCDDPATATSWGSETVPVIDFNWDVGAPAIVQANNDPPSEPVPGGVGGPTFVLDAGSSIGISAERYHDRSSASVGGQNHTWTEYSDANAIGGVAMRAEPINGDDNAGSALSGVTLDYRINFPVAGNYRAYFRLRAGPDGGSDDSIRVSLNGSEISPTGGTGFTGFGTSYSDRSLDFSAPAGEQTLRVHMREDGAIFDELFIRAPGNNDPIQYTTLCHSADPNEYWQARYERPVTVTELTTLAFNIQSNDLWTLYVQDNQDGQYLQIGNSGSGSVVSESFVAGTHNLRIDFRAGALDNGNSLALFYSQTGSVFHSDDDMNDDYPAHYSASVFLDGIISLPAGNPVITWWENYDINDNNDWMYFEVNTVGGDDPDIGGANTWDIVYQQLGGGNTESNGWVQRVVDLSPYAGQDIMIRFRLASLNSGNNSNGWSIDDIDISD